MEHPKLPKWATIDNGQIVVNPRPAYEEALAALGNPAPDQYWMEVARRCCTERVVQIARDNLDIMVALGSTVISLKILRDKFALLTDYPPGAGAHEGSFKFRQHYQTYLNGLPKE